MTVMYSVSVGSAADGSSEHVAVGSFVASVPVGTSPESLEPSFPSSEPSFGPSSEPSSEPSSPVHVEVGAESPVVEVGASLDESVEVGTSLDESSVPVTVALNGAAVTLKLASSS